MAHLLFRVPNDTSSDEFITKSFPPYIIYICTQEVLIVVFLVCVYTFWSLYYAVSWKMREYSTTGAFCIFLTPTNRSVFKYIFNLKNI